MAAWRPPLSRVQFDSPSASTSSISLSLPCVPSAVLKAPVVEMITFSALEDGKGSGPGSMADALGEFTRKIWGCLGVASGNVLEYDGGGLGWSVVVIGGSNSVVMAVGSVLLILLLLLFLLTSCLSPRLCRTARAIPSHFSVCFYKGRGSIYSNGY
jgi:hypothetical protein